MARTLASLVSAAVEGMVREVIVLDRGSSDKTSRVADLSGCLFVSDATLNDGVQRARGDWLLLIEPGARLGEGWTQDVRRHVAGGGSPGRFTRKRSGFRDWLPLKRRGLGAGLLVSRQEALVVMREGWNGSTLARTVRAQRLDAEILRDGK
ncbi:glycosyl transferase family 2 [Tianweitania aestuarii]|uniref:glycosyl transferase family 2 n=1 Tax=Tianweitania aestuarii TaxID=2814886 RepID=UPI002022F18A|nr:glycosyl transferase family 2 [Tianweitania aestuarii]